MYNIVLSLDRDDNRSLNRDRLVISQLLVKTVYYYNILVQRLQSLHYLQVYYFVLLRITETAVCKADLQDLSHARLWGTCQWKCCWRWYLWWWGVMREQHPWMQGHVASLLPYSCINMSACTYSFTISWSSVCRLDLCRQWIKLLPTWSFFTWYFNLHCYL